MSAVYEYMGGTRGSCVVATDNDVLEMSVVRGVCTVGGVCEICMCLAQGGVGSLVVSGCEDWV